MIWTLPQGDSRYLLRWSFIKKEFTVGWLRAGGRQAPASASRARRGEAGVWQPRYWEHTIHDESDFERCVEYVHYNPVKHGHAKCPHAWRHSSFHRYLREGLYDAAWCCCCGPHSAAPPDFTDIEPRTGE